MGFLSLSLSFTHTHTLTYTYTLYMSHARVCVCVCAIVCVFVCVLFNRGLWGEATESQGVPVSHRKKMWTLTFSSASLMLHKCFAACPETTFGQDCRENCSTNCTDSVCNATTGACLSCIQGSTGDFCDKSTFFLNIEI